MMRTLSCRRGTSWSWYQLLLIAASTLILCSCRSAPLQRSEPATANGGFDAAASGEGALSPSTAASDVQPAVQGASIPRSLSKVEHDLIDHQVQAAAHHAPLPDGPSQLPATAWTGAAEPMHGWPYRWTPPHISPPWPADEYLFDGGDRNGQVHVRRDWTVVGLDQEDTIAHFDTIDGETLVQASNRVPIYAPRFAAVRRVSGMVQHEQHQRMAGVEKPLRIVSQEERRLATTVVQPLQPRRNLGINTANSFRDRALGSTVDNTQQLAGVRDDFMPFEDFLIIRKGIFLNSEKARLSARVQAAWVWSADQQVQVVIDDQLAAVSTGDSAAQETCRYEMPPGKPRLRIVKVASRQNARPGETIDFTIRFDNIGDQEIGNVTIIDNLTTRLEYVPDSAQCSREANFVTADNEGESLVLRWEIIDPMKVGDGGIIRFQCRVR